VLAQTKTALTNILEANMAQCVTGRSYETGCQVKRSGRARGVWSEGEQAGGSGDRPLSHSRIGTAVHGFARRLPLTNSGGSELA